MKISDTKEFNHEVLKQLSNPHIRKTDKQMYERIIQIMKDEFKEVPAGMVMDTLKLIIFNVIRAGMEEQTELEEEKEREFYR
jgi:hypothetical protein